MASSSALRVIYQTYFRCNLTSLHKDIEAKTNSTIARQTVKNYIDDKTTTKPQKRTVSIIEQYLRTMEQSIQKNVEPKQQEPPAKQQASPTKKQQESPEKKSVQKCSTRPTKCYPDERKESLAKTAKCHPEDLNSLVTGTMNQDRSNRLPPVKDKNSLFANVNSFLGIQRPDIFSFSEASFKHWRPNGYCGISDSFCSGDNIVCLWNPQKMEVQNSRHDFSRNGRYMGVTLKTENTLIAVVNVHLPKKNKKQAHLDFTKYLEEVKERVDHVIVNGDCNIRPEQVAEIVPNCMRPIFHLKDGPTTQKNSYIDNVVASNGLDVLSKTIFSNKREFSHFPLTANLRLLQ